MSIRVRGAVTALAPVVVLFAAAGCGRSGPGAQLVHTSAPAVLVGSPGTASPAVVPSVLHIELPSSPARISFRQVYRSNVPPGGLSTPDPTGSLQPSATDLSDYANLDCSLASKHAERPTADVANEFLVTCGDPDDSPTWYKFLLYPATVSSNDVASVKAEYDEADDGTWDVSLLLTSNGKKAWATFTGSHVGTLVAIVINGKAFSAEVIEGEITGPTVIVSQLSASDAKALAAALEAARAKP